MPHHPHSSTRRRRSLDFSAVALERRRLLSGTAIGHPVISIEAPSAYISQQSSQLDITLVRATRSGRSDSKGSITVNFTATYASTAAQATADQFTPVDQSVTFPPGQATETVVVPVNSAAANPGLVPIELTATPSAHQVKGSTATVYLASTADAIPPSITGVQRVAGGIAVTFSKPMDPATVQNIHNYSIKFSPKQNFNFDDLYGVGLVQSLDTASSKVPLRRATYNSNTNTVLLVATEQLGSKGSYRISSPASLLAKKVRPADARALTDTFGNVLDQGGRGGSFSITIGPGKPYTSTPETLAAGS